MEIRLIGLGERFNAGEVFWLAEVEPLLEKLIIRVVIHVAQISTPMLCDLAFEVKEVAVLPAVERLLLGRFVVKHALLTVELHDFAGVDGHAAIHRYFLAIQTAARGGCTRMSACRAF